MPAANYGPHSLFEELKKSNKKRPAKKGPLKKFLRTPLILAARGELWGGGGRLLLSSIRPPTDPKESIFLETHFW